MPASPDWLVQEPYREVDHGVIKSGKEAQVSLVERLGDDGTSCFVARKRYLPRQVKEKGQLEALGFQGVSTFSNDARYRDGRQFRNSRDRRAVERKSSYGRRLLQDRWTAHEFEIMLRLWEHGLSVPFPISCSDDSLDIEYVGCRDVAAPQLSAARLDRADRSAAYRQLAAGLRILATAGIAHGDLSAYNLLWWEGQLWFIDFPQAVDLAANLQGLDYLHRDVVNVCTWFQRRGHDADAEELFADLLAYL